MHQEQSRIPEVEETAITALGFPRPTTVQGLHSIAHLFKSSDTRCGIYLLALENRQFYIGQSTQVVRRFAQHLKLFGTVVAFAFMPTPPARLDEREKALIFSAEVAGLTLSNIVHATHDDCESDLDALLSPAQQRLWLNDPAANNQQDWLTQPVSLTTQPRHAQRIKRLRAHPLGEAAVLQLYLYLESAIPHPRLTEYSFWSVSCLPSTNASSAPRLLCVSASVMELFCLGYHPSDHQASLGWGFMNVASDVLWNEFGNPSAFQQRFMGIEMCNTRNYRDGGQHQITLYTERQSDMLALLLNRSVMKAGATLALRVMKKRANIYHRFHCPPLAHAALAYRGSAVMELSAAINAARTRLDPKNENSHRHLIALNT